MVKGSLKDISFIELLQLMQLARKTGRIEIVHEAKWAMVVFKEGQVWHVEPRGFHANSPEEAVYTLIALNEGTFTFQRVQILPVLDRTVMHSTETLIMEGTKRLDDGAAVASEIGDEQQLSMLLKFKPGAEAKVRYVPQNVKRVLQAIDGNRNIADVIKLSQLDAPQAAQIIKELVSHGILEMAEPAGAAKTE